jgi:hypothetical protein
MMTPTGIGVDSPYSDTNLEEIDRTVGRIEACLDELASGNYMPSADAQCLTNYVRPAPIRRNCLKIKIVTPVKSRCSEWHFLKEAAPKELCEAKGLETNEECPCRWRWAVQGDNHLIIPTGHSDYLYLYDIVRIHTGCNNYWADEELTKCAQEVQ